MHDLQTGAAMTKKAIITGITRQNGSYLAEFLLEKGCEVHGIKRWASLFNTQRVDHIYQDPHIDNARFKLHYGDLTDTSNLTRILQEVQPDEVYNLGAQSHVAVSFEARPCSPFRQRDRNTARSTTSAAPQTRHPDLPLGDSKQSPAGTG